MPEIVTRYIDVYPFRRAVEGTEFLLLKRQPDARIGGTWQAVHGKIETGETAAAAALRELREETGLAPIRFWQLDAPNIFFIADLDQVVIAPCFAAEIDPAAVVQLNHEHTAFRWEAGETVLGALLWPGQRQAVESLKRCILNPHAAAERFLRIPL